MYTIAFIDELPPKVLPLIEYTFLPLKNYSGWLSYPHEYYCTYFNYLGSSMAIPKGVWIYYELLGGPASNKATDKFV